MRSRGRKKKIVKKSPKRKKKSRRRRKFRASKSGGGESKEDPQERRGFTSLPPEMIREIIKAVGCFNLPIVSRELSLIRENWHLIKTLDPETLRVKIVILPKNSDEGRRFEEHGLGLNLDLRGENLSWRYLT